MAVWSSHLVQLEATFVVLFLTDFEELPSLKIVEEGKSSVLVRRKVVNVEKEDRNNCKAFIVLADRGEEGGRRIKPHREDGAEREDW